MSNPLTTKPIQPREEPCGHLLQGSSLYCSPVPLTLPPVDKINLDKIDWIIVTEKNFKEVFADLDKKNFDPVIFGLSDRGYESLSVNTAKIKQLVEQQRLIIIAYEEYYKKTNDSIDEFNKEEEKPQEQEETLVGRGRE